MKTYIQWKMFLCRSNIWSSMILLEVSPDQQSLIYSGKLWVELIIPFPRNENSHFVNRLRWSINHNWPLSTVEGFPHLPGIQIHSEVSQLSPSLLLKVQTDDRICWLASVIVHVDELDKFRGSRSTVKTHCLYEGPSFGTRGSLLKDKVFHRDGGVRGGESQPRVGGGSLLTKEQVSGGLTRGLFTATR